MIINNILPLITPTQGKYGRMVLSDSWKVYVINRKPITPDIVESTLDNFLQARRLEAELLDTSHVTPLDQLDYQEYSAVQLNLRDNGSWFRIPFQEAIMQGPSSGNWLERAWHGFKMESLASILLHGIQDSGPNVFGSRYENNAGFYCCGDKRIYRAAGYTNAVPSGDNLSQIACLP